MRVLLKSSIKNEWKKRHKAPPKYNNEQQQQRQQQKRQIKIEKNKTINTIQIVVKQKCSLH